MEKWYEVTDNLSHLNKSLIFGSRCCLLHEPVSVLGGSFKEYEVYSYGENVKIGICEGSELPLFYLGDSEAEAIRKQYENRMRLYDAICWSSKIVLMYGKDFPNEDFSNCSSFRFLYSGSEEDDFLIDSKDALGLDSMDEDEIKYFSKLLVHMLHSIEDKSIKEKTYSFSDFKKDGSCTNFYTKESVSIHDDNRKDYIKKVLNIIL